MKMYYTIYKITNTINNKIYIGMHQTKNLDDSYYGSGTLIKKAIAKYGIENFTKEYIAVCDNKGDMIDMERELVNEDFINDSNTYNISLGGVCGENNAEMGGRANAEKMKNDPKAKQEWIDNISKARSSNESRLKRISTIQSRYPDGFPQGFGGCNHSEESKMLIGVANSKIQSGSGNSQYGTMWIYNLDLKESKRINKNDPIPDGWLRGRKIKF